MRKYLVFSICLITLIALIIGSGYTTKEQPKESADEKTIVERAEYKEPELGIEVSYPQLAGLAATDSQAKINRKIKGLIFNKIQEAKDSMDECQTEHFYYTINYEIVYQNKNILSMVYWQEVNWGLYPSVSVFTENIDLKTGEQVEISSLFMENTDYKQIIEEAIKKKGKIKIFGNQPEFNYAEYVKEICLGEDNYLENNDLIAYNLTRDSLKIFYSVPHVLGDVIVCEIPYDYLIKNIDTQGQTWSNIKE